MIKKIFILWFQGFDKAPEVVQKCLASWRHYNNRTWQIITLSDSNLRHYVPQYQLFKHLSHPALSDIVRILLLTKYGGCWVDATTFCNKPLDDWLPKKLAPVGFFAFSRPSPDKELSSWFLYFSQPNHYMAQKWMRLSLQTRDRSEYFWFHFLFNKLTKEDLVFKKLWSLVPKVPANKTPQFAGPHILQKEGLTKPYTQEIKNNIDKKLTPLYKLTHKFNPPESFNKMLILHYLYSTIVS
jgi:hypothetical protein